MTWIRWRWTWIRWIRWRGRRFILSWLTSSAEGKATPSAGKIGQVKPEHFSVNLLTFPSSAGKLPYQPGAAVNTGEGDRGLWKDHARPLLEDQRACDQRSSGGKVLGGENSLNVKGNNRAHETKLALPSQYLQINWLNCQ